MGIFTAFLDDADVRLYGFEAGGEGVDSGRHAAADGRRLAGRPARHPHLRPAGRDGPDRAVALGLGRPRLPRRRPAARLAARHRPRDVRADHRRRGDGRVRPALPHRGHHPGHRERPRAGRRAARSAASSDRTRRSWSTCPAAATRTSTPRPTWFGVVTDEEIVESATAVVEQDPQDAAGRGLVTAPVSRSTTSSRDRGPRAGPRSSATCPPATRRSQGAVDAMVAMVARRRRRRRGRPALLRPADGRPDDPARRRGRAGARHHHRRRARRPCAAVAATGAPTLVMTYWNPIERYGARRFAEGLAAAGGAGVITPDLTPDEAGDRAVRLARRHRRDRPRTGSSSSRRPRPTQRHPLDRRALPRLRLRRLHDGRHRRPRLRRRRRRRAGRPGARASPTCRCASVSACPTATRRPRSRPSPTASSSGRRSSGRCSTPASPADGVRRGREARRRAGRRGPARPMTDGAPPRVALTARLWSACSPGCACRRPGRRGAPVTVQRRAGLARHRGPRRLPAARRRPFTDSRARRT